jgi:carboxyl-terminal processing protease
MTTRTRNRRRLSAGLAILLAAVAAAGLAMLPAAAGDPKPDLDSDFFEPLDWLIHQMDESGIQEVGDEDLLVGAYQGILNTLDDYSTYWPPDRAREATDDLEGEFGGLGIQITFDLVKKAVRVEQPIAGTPAARVGVLAQDLIVEIHEEIDGQVRITKTADFDSVHDAVRVLRGRVGSEVTIVVVRGETAERREFTIVRDTIRIPGVRAAEVIDPDRKIGYLYLHYFSQPTPHDLSRAIVDLIGQGAAGLVLDLRLNPGGLLDQAEECVDLFLDADMRIVTIKERGREPEHHNTLRRALFDKVPIVVLVNRYSASGAEILAGALKDHKRAVVIGEPTYGKASVQKLFGSPFDRGAAFKLTVAHYYTPNGTDIHRTGVSPHIEVRLPDEKTRKLAQVLSLRTEYPPPSEEAIRRVLPDADISEGNPLENFEDVQLDKAVDVLAEIMQGRSVEAYIAALEADTPDTGTVTQ